LVSMTTAHERKLSRERNRKYRAESQEKYRATQRRRDEKKRKGIIFFMCLCGKMQEKRSNVQKYCSDCARRIKGEQTMQYFRKRWDLDERIGLALREGRAEIRR